MSKTYFFLFRVINLTLNHKTFSKCSNGEIHSDKKVYQMLGLAVILASLKFVLLFSLLVYMHALLVISFAQSNVLLKYLF